MEEDGELSLSQALWSQSTISADESTATGTQSSKSSQATSAIEGNGVGGGDDADDQDHIGNVDQERYTIVFEESSPNSPWISRPIFRGHVAEVEKRIYQRWKNGYIYAVKVI